MLTVVGLQTGSLLAGAVLTETIFSWPGIGKWLIDSIARRDYPVVQAGILISALTFIGVNLRRGPALWRGQSAHSRRGALMSAVLDHTVPPSPAQEFWRGFAANRARWRRCLCSALITVACLFAPLVAPYDPIRAVPRRDAGAAGLGRGR